MIGFGWGLTCAGNILVAFTDRGLCALRLIGNPSQAEVVDELERTFPGSKLIEDQEAARVYVEQAEDVLQGRLPSNQVPLDMQGTPFQKRVWKALMQVPWGTTCSYTELARRAGNPNAVRAAASACARNPVALIVPCHRILRQDGSLGGYYYGLAKKREILQIEHVEV